MSETKQVTKAAFRFTSPLRFERVSGESLTAPISMLARVSEPIDHWYWGKIVHDFSGMKHKPTIPVDWEHQQEIGYLDKFNVDDDGLHVGGEIVPFSTDDKASELIHKGQRGVPYEASIDWSGNGTKIQNVEEGELVTVNGKEFSGPLTVVREWPLRAVAVCKFGADGGTKSRFADDEQENQEVTYLSEEITMAEDIAVVEDEKQDTELVEDVTQDSEPDTTADAKKFIDTFGDRGARWFIEGKSFEDALREHTAELEKKLKAAEDKAAAAEAAVGSETVTEHTEEASDEKKTKGFGQFIRIRDTIK